jgi:hypothetical protein
MRGKNRRQRDENIPFPFDHFGRTLCVGRDKHLLRQNFGDLFISFESLDRRNLLGPRKIVAIEYVHLLQVFLHGYGSHQREECV